MKSSELRAFLKRHNMSASELAALLDYTPQAVQNWLEGTRPVSVLIARLLKQFDKWPGLMQEFCK